MQFQPADIQEDVLAFIADNEQFIEHDINNPNEVEIAEGANEGQDVRNEVAGGENVGDDAN